MGRGMSVSKLAFFEVKNKYVTEMQQTQNKLKQQVEELQEALAKMNSRVSVSEQLSCDFFFLIKEHKPYLFF